MSSLTIAFVPGVSPAKWARVWRERFPDVELVLLPIGADDVTDALDGSADMAFARLPVADELSAIPLWQETPVVAAPKDSIFASVDSLTTADIDGTAILVDHLGATGSASSTVPSNVDGVLDLVEAGVGVAILPQSLFRAASRRSLVGRPITDIAPTQVALAWRSADASPHTEEFIGIVRGRTANSSRGAAAAQSAPARPQPASAKRAQPPRPRGQRGARKGRPRPRSR